MEAYQQAMMHAEIQDCTFCSDICNNGKKVLGSGNFEEDRILLIGEVGLLLQEMIIEAGMDFNHIYNTNIIKCRTTNNRDPLQEEIENCRGYLAAQIYALRPAIIILVGRKAMEAVISIGIEITKAAGTFHKFYANTSPINIALFKRHIKKYGINTPEALLSIAMPILHPNDCGGAGSDEYKKTVNKFRNIWKDYKDQLGWYTLLNDVPF